MPDQPDTERDADTSPVTATRFPAQYGAWLQRRVAVCFDYDTSAILGGTIVRCDTDPPGLMIIRLDDGRHIMSTECQYTFDETRMPDPTIGSAP